MKSRFVALLALGVLLVMLLAIPAAPLEAAPPTDGPIVHQVRSGENLSLIAWRYGVTAWQIVQANGLSNANLIYVGQFLVIPTQPVAFRGHVVRYGETLGSIAQLYGVSQWDLIQANGIANPNRIYVGQRLIIPAQLPPATLPVQAGESRYYAETGHWVRFGFLQFFDRYGGVDVFGYPVSEEFVQDGIVVQYFQRLKLEWHPNNPLDERVQVGPLGRLVHGQIDPPPAGLDPAQYPTRRYFAETGHTAGFGFLEFFNARGGTRVFGPPITEEYVEGGLTVQYFLNARFEWHPQNPDPYKVQLGLLGIQVYSGQVSIAGLPPTTPISPTAGMDLVGSLARIWRDPAVGGRLGAPTAPQQTGWMAEQPFQGGYLFWRPENFPIHVLYNEGTWQIATNLWGEGLQLSETCCDAPPGLYVPTRGFGYLWRSSQKVRDRLGYATAPERGYNVLIQDFQRGLMLVSDSRHVYVLYSDGTWQKFAE